MALVLPAGGSAPAPRSGGADPRRLLPGRPIRALSRPERVQRAHLEPLEMRYPLELQTAFGPLGPAVDVVDDGVAGVVGDPDSVQSPPSPFFGRTCSSINSETTSSLRRSFSRRAAMVRWFSLSAGLPLRSKAAAPFS